MMPLGFESIEGNERSERAEGTEGSEGTGGIKRDEGTETCIEEIARSDLHTEKVNRYMFYFSWTYG